METQITSPEPIVSSSVDLEWGWHKNFHFWQVPSCCWSRDHILGATNFIPLRLFYKVVWVSLGAQMIKTACNAGDPALIPGLGRFLGEGNGYPLQYPCLENSLDRGAWRATVHGIAKSWTQLNDYHVTALHYVYFHRVESDVPHFGKHVFLKNSQRAVL